MSLFSRIGLFIAVILCLVGCSTITTPTAVVRTDTIIQAEEPVEVVSVKEDVTPTDPVIAAVEVPATSPLDELIATFETSDVPTYNFTEKDVQCLAHNLYREARGEGELGMSAVGYVVLNRTQARGFPSTVCGVIYEKRYVKGRPFCQFSWVCRPPKGRIQPSSFERAREIAILVLKREIRNPIGNALYFHERSIRPPRFAKASNYVGAVGNHRFFSAL